MRVNPELSAWLATLLGQPPDAVETLRPEASFRSFFRVTTSKGTVVAMDAPPDKEDAARFVRLARLMSSHGIPVPAILAADESRGFVLMEDLGRIHLIDLYRQGNIHDALAIAVDTLLVLQQLPARELPPYTRERLDDELAIFTTWFVQDAMVAPRPAEWAEFSEDLVASVADQPVTAIHRDWHCKNLLVRDGRLGIVDFQDALAGPALYDLASLLRDCYWVFDEATVRSMLDRYLEASPLRFDNPLYLLNRTALQRQLKAIGIFARLRLRDGKTSHLDYIDGVLAQSARLARSSFPQLSIADWLESLRQRWPDCHRRMLEVHP